MLRLTVSPDQLAAYLDVLRPTDNQAEVGLAEALVFVAEAGVIYGVDSARVDRALETCNGPMLVAQGRAPVQGTDAEVKISPSLLEIGGRPQVDADGRVDLFSLNLIRNVRAGALLAMRRPPTMGLPGISVHGESVIPRPVHTARFMGGDGTTLSEDGRQLVSAIDGHAVIVGQHISVSSVYEVHGDVGVATGHVDFVGSVVIGGDVTAGFDVTAEGDVEVQGSVNGGTIEAGGNVSVRYGVRGQARVVAGGGVRAKFVEYAEVRAGGDVWVADGIVQGRLDVGGRIEVLGRYGSIIGGHIVARLGVSARTLGSEHGMPTSIEVGVATDVQPTLGRLDDELRDLIAQAKLFRTRLRFLSQQASEGRLNQRGVRELQALCTQLEEVGNLQGRIVATRSLLAETQSAIQTAVVDARERCHTLVQIRIGNAVHTVTEAQPHVRFFLSESAQEVAMTSLH